MDKNKLWNIELVNYFTGRANPAMERNDKSRPQKSGEESVNSPIDIKKIIGIM